MERSKDLAVCLVSGGMDSLVTAAIASTKHESLAFLHLNYGQRTEKRELESFKKIAEHFISHHPATFFDMKDQLALALKAYAEGPER